MKNISRDTVFTGTKDFEAFHLAADYAEQMGYSVGSLQRDSPVGLKKGNYIVSKWRNLSSKDKQELDGMLISRDFRKGPVTLKVL